MSDNTISRINGYLNKIRSGENIRPILTELKEYLKTLPEGLGSGEIAGELADGLKIYLGHDDPKVRKNTVQILKIISDGKSLMPLTEAYLKEETLYNRASYVEALSSLDISPVRDLLTTRFESLRRGTYEESEKKHIIEEGHALACLFRNGRRHIFTGHDKVNEVVLLTNRNFKSVTAEELGSIPHREFTAGVMAKTRHIDRILPVRTFSELLFVPDTKTVSANPGEAAGEIINGGILDYLKERHDNPDDPFYFRIEYRCRDPKNKASYEKKLAAGLEYLSRFDLINSTDDYEIEFRLIENSSGSFQFLVDMRTLPDKRFTYRKSVISAGMKPSLAALLVRLSKEHIRDNAAVLDAFCGSGIFLVERDLFRSTRLMYGIDIFGEAVLAARNNISNAGLSSKTEIINRDITDFRHQYRFDEIYADMPQITQNKDRSSIGDLYEVFLKKAGELLEEDGRLFIYTHNRDILKRSARSGIFRIAAEFEISKIEEAYYYILER